MKPILSVVTTLYKSDAYINDFVRRVSSAATALVGENYEIVLVNDGSPDDSLTSARQLTKTFATVRVIDLSRNFGHHKAIMTGLSFAKGEYVFLIDVDLEEPPECLATFWMVMERKTCDVVFGIQEKRKGKFLERVGGRLFWALLAHMTSAHVSASPLTARLMTRRYVDALLLHKEREVFLAGLFAITGFEQISVPVKKAYRGTTSYSASKRLQLLVRAVTSFSSRPLIWIFYFGVLVSLFSMAIAVWLTYRRLSSGSVPEGWTSVLVSVWLLGGIMISFIGVVGIYLSRVFSEVKSRPHTIVRAVYDNERE
ncbi:MAG: glycosyltransferase family 2 protein [Mesorhizobium sp.]